MRILFIGHTRRGDAVLSTGLLGHLIPGARVALFGAGAERPQSAPVLAALPAPRRVDLLGAAGYDHCTTDSLMGSLEFEATAAVAPWRRARGEAV